MCGIAGLLADATIEVEDRLSAMIRSLRHRGPDDEGRFQSEILCETGTRWHLGFRRLAVIDLTADGHQPMVDDVTGNVLILNGEIYNFRDLRPELEAAGYRFRSRCDAEVVLYGYAQWGLSVVDHLRGMFAFALFDRANEQVVLARDRMGEKPLYYCNRPAGEGIRFAFASEVRTLLAGDVADRSIDECALRSYVANGFVTGPRSLIRGIRLLNAGCLLTVDATGRSTERRFWELPDPSTHNGRYGGPAALRDLLADTVRRQVVSDAPLGAFLSGGIDSSIVVGLAQRQREEPLRTFTLTFEEDEYSEARYAALVAQAFGTDHEEIQLTRSEFRSSLPAVIGALDQPSFDGANTFFVARAARQLGLTVALAGTGGDELFGGYSSFSQLRRLKFALGLLSPVPSAIRSALRSAALSVDGWWRGGFPSQASTGKSLCLLNGVSDLTGVYDLLYRIFLPETAAQLVDPSLGNGASDLQTGELAGDLPLWVRSRFDLTGLSFLELRHYLGNRLLRDTDSVSMAVSLEIRLPLIDYRIVELAFSVSEMERFYPLGTKRCLVEASGVSLPDAIRQRRKQGFVLPIDNWLRGALVDEAAETLLDPSLCRRAGLEPRAVERLWRQFLSGDRGLYWTRLWALYVLLRWCDLHGVSVMR